MTAPLKLESRTFPSRIADLGFTALLPADWIAHSLPSDGSDLTQPTEFFPLAVVTAPHAAIIFAVAARPAHGDGTLNDWAWYHLNHSQLKPRAVGSDRVAGVPAIVGEAIQDSELGTLVVRFAFFEDGGRLVNLSLSAPEMLADAVREVWFGSCQSFTLENPKGSRFSAEAVDPNPGPAPVASEASRSPEEVPTPTREKPPRLADFALANDASALDPEAAINVNFRNRGAGLVPNVLATNTQTLCATVAAGAVMALFDVPFGWYVIDDGKRTLMLDPGGKVQINLSLLRRDGRDDSAILDDLEAAAVGDYPAPEFSRLSSGKINALGVRNIADGDQAIEQYHFLMTFRDEAFVVRARITATPDKAGLACTLGELILNSFRLPQPEPRPLVPITQAAAPPAAEPMNPSNPDSTGHTERTESPSAGESLPAGTCLNEIAVACRCHPAFHRSLVPANELCLYGCLRCGTVTCTQRVGDEGRFSGEAFTAYITVEVPTGVMEWIALWPRVKLDHAGAPSRWPMAAELVRCPTLLYPANLRCESTDELSVAEARLSREQEGLSRAAALRRAQCPEIPPPAGIPANLQGFVDLWRALQLNPQSDLNTLVYLAQLRSPASALAADILISRPDAFEVLEKAIRSSNETWRSAGIAMARDFRGATSRLTELLLTALSRASIEPSRDLPGRVVGWSDIESLLVVIADLKLNSAEMVEGLAHLQRRLRRSDDFLLAAIAVVIQEIS